MPISGDCGYRVCEGSHADEGVIPPRPKCGQPRGCCFKKVEYLICSAHQVDCLYICPDCEHYHICDGGDDCIFINTGESIVCFLTGNCVSDNVQEFSSLLVKAHKPLDSTCEDYTYYGIAGCIKRDIFVFFNRDNSNLKEIRDAVSDETALKPDISRLVDITLKVTIHLFGKNGYGYDLICSMYVQIIISIYSTRTVYNNLLFKSTRNKRYDTILKRIRELWMSTLATGGSVPIDATT
ncbi:hypothetical protein [Rhinolophus gammaherpesvirus 1]|uniref:Uncharacterized protein n=1 Tax=Rhinolophus gammaherpesvirus 1 TaxID=2054179 RepID=A0A2Z5U7B9_9GAMA|nr:hypothetical protein [Rhinolophus gammaherpesvirus 1]BBB06480.1 hypothetical protein [Rhinolophus gammaherpesvirus 1]